MRIVYQSLRAVCASGFPTMVNALALAKEIFDHRGIVVPDATIAERSLEELETQGRAIRQGLQMHTAPYSGFPRALNAVALAQAILGR